MTSLLKGAMVVYGMEIFFDSDGGDKLESSEKEIEEWTRSLKG
jgi:hypothetical protein